PSERIDWQLAADNNPVLDRFGNQTILSGYNQFIKANISRWYALDLISTGVAGSTAPAVAVSNFQLFSLEFERNTDGTVTCTFEYAFHVDNTTGIFMFNADVSLPLNRGVTTYYGRYVWIDGAQMTSNSGRLGTVVLSGKFP